MITAIIISTIAGATVGYTIAAMLMIGRRSEPKAPPKEPTRLFTAGCLVKWGGECHEMLLMYEGDDHQTYTNILNRQGIIFTEVPIEELESVEE